ncbi:glycerate kinase type-2 family protein [Roseicitreum antarcticum]|uniref:Hydroxypyruvate reductase n=1 Tax=Roseicitreum antarcticum TaxID=564137 RepID=A0A1H2W868_9RHOB|nr:DUF4147 domain-containing protein [Roseicitreum antarcticum]SDW76239.1 hydroxypyruvate reductase [Roseicitreum antarcticum]
MPRHQIINLFEAGILAADPSRGVAQALRTDPVRLSAGGRLFVLAVGKAAARMMRAALPLVPAPAKALVVTNYENAAPVSGAEVLAAGHPVPDEAGLAAGQAVMRMLAEAGPDDQVLALISGGGSALLPAPTPPLTLEDKAALSRLLLGAGLDIVAMNSVRQHLSELKGGGLLRQAAPAQVRALILSDVIGDDLRAIASGMTAEPLLSRDAAVALLKTAELWTKLPPSVRDALAQPQTQEPLPKVRNQLIGSNRMSLDAMKAVWPDAVILSDALTGDVAAAAAQIIAHARTAGPAPLMALFGGETTVNLKGTGMGGRNQELALRVAMGLDGWPRKWLFLSGGTDGRDGPTDAAGGLTAPDTLHRIRAAGGDPAALLANNDSYQALDLAGHLLRTNATGTNVADLQILLLDAANT